VKAVLELPYLKGLPFGPGDGTGTVCDIVNKARAAGIAWAQSAENYAHGHWRGNFVDSNNDG
jgi:hypothetical protein